MRSYATVQEFLNHPTGLDVDNLVADGTEAQQTTELAMILQMASSVIDAWCYQPLYAHQKMETKHVRPQQYGSLEVRVSDFPLKQVVSAQWRQTARDAWHSIDTTLIDIFGDIGEGHKYSAADAYYGGTYGWGQPPLTVQTTYIAGYPNMALTANAAVGAQAITVDSFIGVSQGDVLKIYDGQSYEEVTVQATPTSNTISVSALQFAHNTGVRVSELPDAVSVSCIFIAAYLIKERRAGASVTMSGTVQKMNVIDSEDMQLARQFLLPFRRVI
jgi:hypothetical protein